MEQTHLDAKVMINLARAGAVPNAILFTHTEDDTTYVVGRAGTFSAAARVVWAVNNLTGAVSELVRGRAEKNVSTTVGAPLVEKTSRSIKVRRQEKTRKGIMQTTTWTWACA